MYVCVCNAVTERDINKAVDAGCHTMRELHDELGVAACCGRCASCARSVLRESLGQPPRHQPTTMFAHAAI